MLATRAAWPEISNPLKIVLSTFYQDDQEITSHQVSEQDCSGCSQNSVSVFDSDPVLTAVRVEYVKQQILRKLRLTKPPEISISLLSLPQPLVNGHVIEFRPGEPYENENPAESFFGKTNQLVIFPVAGDLSYNSISLPKIVCKLSFFSHPFRERIGLCNLLFSYHHSIYNSAIYWNVFSIRFFYIVNFVNRVFFFTFYGFFKYLARFVTGTFSLRGSSVFFFFTLCRTKGAFIHHIACMEISCWIANWFRWK